MSAPVIVPNENPELVALIGDAGATYTRPIVGWLGDDPVVFNGPTDGNDFVAAIFDTSAGEFTFVTDCPDCQAIASAVIEDFLASLGIVKP